MPSNGPGCVPGCWNYTGFLGPGISNGSSRFSMTSWSTSGGSNSTTSWTSDLVVLLFTIKWIISGVSSFIVFIYSYCLGKVISLKYLIKHKTLEIWGRGKQILFGLRHETYGIATSLGSSPLAFTLISFQLVSLEGFSFFCSGLAL